MAPDGANLKHSISRTYSRPNDGRQIHIVSSPDAAERVKKELTRDTSSDDQFDLCVQGSPEHLEALRELQGHHEQTRQQLRDRHGALYDEFERVQKDLAGLSSDISHITKRPVDLNANFSKFGFSANLRTHQSHGDPSAPVSDEGDIANGHGSGAPEDNSQAVVSIPLFKRPVVRQYHHKGLIWRSPNAEEVMPYELFIDLLYVALLGILGDRVARDPSGRTLLEFAVTYLMAWKLWTEATMIVQYFEQGDMLQRMSVLLFLVLLIGFMTNIENAFESTYTEFVAFYLASRFEEIFYFGMLSFFVPMIRWVLISQVIIILIPNALWIVSIHVEEPNRWPVIWIALFLDYILPSAVITTWRNLPKLPFHWARETLPKRMQYYPAVNIEHRIERFGAFTTLVLGVSVVAFVYQDVSEGPPNAFYGKAVLGLIGAFCLNMIYFEVDSKNIHVHAIRRGPIQYTLWIHLHIPFLMAITLSAGALSRLVLVDDVPGTSAETLTEGAQADVAETVSSGLRWFFSAGLGVALASMAGIALVHEHRHSAQQRLRKSYRLLARGTAAVVLICLPLATDLNSLSLLGIATAAVVFVLVVDLVGLTPRNRSIWWKRMPKNDFATAVPMTPNEKDNVNGLPAHGHRAEQDISAA